MQTDQLGLWLQNRHLITNIDDISLKSKQADIIKVFGDFRQILLKLLAHHHDLTWIQHHKLSTVLYRQESALDVKSYGDDVSSPSSVSSSSSSGSSALTLKLTSLPTNTLCYINTYMTTKDMARNQSICILFCKINRMTASYTNPKYSMRQLSVVPYLPQYIEWTLNKDNIETKLKGLKNMKQVLLFHSTKVIRESGIIPYILKAINVNGSNNNNDKLNAWNNVINEELQLEIISFLQLCCDNKECTKTIMNNGGAEIFTSALNKVLMDYNTLLIQRVDLDYTQKMIQNISGILDVITANYSEMVNCCRIDLILIIRQLCYGTPGPDWDIINVEDIVIMINKLLPRSKGHLIDLLWALCDIVNNNKNHVNYLIEYQSLDIICDMLCKNKCIQMMYKPLVSLIAKMAADERIDQIMEITENLLRLVQTGSDKNGARKTSRKAVENRRGFLVDYGICDTIINILEFGLDGYMKIEQLDEDGDIDPEIQKNKYLDIMRNGSEIVYYITRSEHNVGSSISNLMDVLVKVFGRMDDEDLKCDILWTFQNMSNDKRCIQHIINSSIIDYILSILLAFEQNEDKMTDYEHEDNEIQKIMLRACFLIIENVACGTSQQLGIICISDFLKLEFDKFMQLDEKISKNVIYTLRAITNGIYRQCKKYLDGDNYQQNAQDSFLRCFTKSKQEDTTKNAKFITDMIHPTIPYLGKLLSNIEDYDLIENIIWIISYIVIDKDWAKVMSSDHEEDMGYFMINIIHLLKKLSFENDDILRRTVIKHIIRGCFIIIRRIANHSDFLAMELLKFNIFDIDLNVYLVHDDGQLITNTTQAIKALLSRTMDVIDVDIKQKLLNVNDGILSSLMSILYLDDGLKLENGEYYDGNTQIRMECTLDIINLMLINQDSDGFEIAKSIGIAGGLDKLLQIQHSPHFLLNVSMKAKNLRESVMNKFVNFVLNP